MLNIKVVFIFVVIGLSVIYLMFQGDSYQKKVNITVHPNGDSDLVDNTLKVVLKRPEYDFIINPKYVKKDEQGSEYLDYEAMYKAALALNNPKQAALMFPELARGNVQHSKWIYMFQYYVYPKMDIPVEKMIPNNYTGIWNFWHENGNICYEYHYENGDLKIYIFSNEGGDRVQKSYYMDEGHVEIDLSYYESGNLKHVLGKSNNEKDSISIDYFENGSISGVGILRVDEDENELYHFYQSNYDNGKVDVINYSKNGSEVVIFDEEDSIDLRPQYAKEIAEFEAELAAFEKEHGLK